MGEKRPAARRKRASQAGESPGGRALDNARSPWRQADDPALDILPAPLRGWGNGF
jgi:hypothetical protein